MKDLQYRAVEQALDSAGERREGRLAIHRIAVQAYYQASIVWPLCMQHGPKGSIKPKTKMLGQQI